MIRFYLDIETIPGDEKLKIEIEQQLTPPKNLTSLDEIAAWKKKETEKLYRDTSLNGNLGRILCLGFIKEWPLRETKQVLKGNEAAVLQSFWDVARDAELFIGHNILDFDLKFIWKRSVINKIKPSKNLSFARYRSDVIYDTMQEWRKWEFKEKLISLDTLAKILDLSTSKGDLDGSKVYDYWQAGRLQEIYDYCMADVELTRKIYKRMNFIEV